MDARWALGLSLCLAVAGFVPATDLAAQVAAPQGQQQAREVTDPQAPAPNQQPPAATDKTPAGEKKPADTGSATQRTTPATGATPPANDTTGGDDTPPPEPKLTIYDHIRGVLFALTIVLALAGIVALAWGVFLLVKAMIQTVNDRGEVVAVYSNWGGFGGGLGGWSLSRSLSLLLGATLLAAIAVGLANVVLHVLDPDRKEESQEQEQTNAGDSSSSQEGESSSPGGKMKMQKATGKEKEPSPSDLSKAD